MRITLDLPVGVDLVDLRNMFDSAKLAHRKTAAELRQWAASGAGDKPGAFITAAGAEAMAREQDHKAEQADALADLVDEAMAATQD